MYTHFYGLRERPFNVTSDPAFLFFSKTHKEAFSHLLYGIRERKGFIAISGEIGAGKTTLCKALLNELDEKTRSAYIFNPSLTGTQLIEAILEDFGVTPQSKNKIVLFRQLNAFLINELRLDHNVILIIDEAQNMKNSLLEEIRMLSNLETDKEKLFQIILVGQPQLIEKLESDELLQLKQRIAVRFHLAPLEGSEITDYIGHRLKVAGGEGRVSFLPEAVEIIHRYSGGIPRLINLVCDRALLQGYVKGTNLVDGAILQSSIAEIENRLEKIEVAG